MPTSVRVALLQAVRNVLVAKCLMFDRAIWGAPGKHRDTESQDDNQRMGTGKTESASHRQQQGGNDIEFNIQQG